MQLFHLLHFERLAENRISTKTRGIFHPFLSTLLVSFVDRSAPQSICYCRTADSYAVEVSVVDRVTDVGLTEPCSISTRAALCIYGGRLNGQTSKKLLDHYHRLAKAGKSQDRCSP